MNEELIVKAFQAITKTSQSQQEFLTLLTKHVLELQEKLNKLLEAVE